MPGRLHHEVIGFILPHRTTVKTIPALVTILSRFLYSVAGLALTAAMFLTVADVILRTFRRPIVGTYELVGLLGAVAVGFAIPQTSRMRGHVFMDFLTEKLPKNVRRVLHVITRLLGIFVFGLIAWNLWALGGDFRKMGEVTLTLHIPLYPFAYGISICCVIETLVLLVELFSPPEREGES